MKQVSPLDLTGILCTDVSILRNGLLTIKGILKPLIDHPDKTTNEMWVEGVDRVVREIDKTLLEEQGIN